MQNIYLLFKESGLVNAILFAMNLCSAFFPSFCLFAGRFSLPFSKKVYVFSMYFPGTWHIINWALGSPYYKWNILLHKPLKVKRLSPDSVLWQTEVQTKQYLLKPTSLYQNLLSRNIFNSILLELSPAQKPVYTQFNNFPKHIHWNDGPIPWGALGYQHVF